MRGKYRDLDMAGGRTLSDQDFSGQAYPDVRAELAVTRTEAEVEQRRLRTPAKKPMQRQRLMDADGPPRKAARGTLDGSCHPLRRVPIYFPRRPVGTAPFRRFRKHPERQQANCRRRQGQYGRREQPINNIDKGQPGISHATQLHRLRMPHNIRS